MVHHSKFWENHFRNNLTKERNNWDQLPQLSKQEKEILLYSIKAWQLGETSEG